ncbi:MAG: phytanoyl-CoA dioxygenase [Phycisphaeraceae bacterium]|nr:phytanoyl-CoA dioxygenase [Phycisphaeraceae bacterium]|tara:strand:- start:308 stop:1111 length:804 start_codon:yes stop_codon:yes gene_type:complete
MIQELGHQAWAEYQAQGYLRLGKIINDEQLATLQQRIDDIMLGDADVDYDVMTMQRDTETGQYGDLERLSKGFKGSTLNYRKIEQLEFDREFLNFMQRPLFREICARVYGVRAAIACRRAMFFNKPSRRGTLLPWHQDRWSDFDRDPLVTLWAALDPATVANGCVQVIPGSHRALVNPDHGAGFLTERQQSEIDESKAVNLEVEAGEVLLLHNWLLHRSDTNRTDVARRAFSVCYMDACTTSKSGKTFSIIFGPGALNSKGLPGQAV